MPSRTRSVSIHSRRSGSVEALRALLVLAAFALSLVGCTTSEGVRCNPTLVPGECASGLECVVPAGCAAAYCCATSGPQAMSVCQACSVDASASDAASE